eukprot:355754-Chlamydomonas_euryale.AAC.23
MANPKQPTASKAYVTNSIRTLTSDVNHHLMISPACTSHAASQPGSNSIHGRNIYVLPGGHRSCICEFSILKIEKSAISADGVLSCRRSYRGSTGLFRKGPTDLVQKGCTSKC